MIIRIAEIEKDKGHKALYVYAEKKDEVELLNQVITELKSKVESFTGTTFRKDSLGWETNEPR